MSASSKAVAATGILALCAAAPGGNPDRASDASAPTSARIGPTAHVATTLVPTDPGPLEVRRIQVTCSTSSER